MAIGSAVDNTSETSGDLNKEAWDKYNLLRTAVLVEHGTDGTHGAVTATSVATTTLTAITTFTAAGNLDIGAYTFRCAGLIDDTLTSGRVVFASTNGLLADDSDLTFSTDTLTATKFVTTSIKLEGGTYDTTIVPGTPSASVSYTWPAADGSNTHVLTTAGNGTLSWAAPTAGANAVLSNLASVAINTSLISDTDNTDDLGSGAKEWKDLYIDGTANIDSLVADTADINGGTIGSVTFDGALTMSMGSDADGDVYYRSSNVLTRLAKGSATQVLAMNSGATAPEWVAAASGAANTALSNLASVAINTSLISDTDNTDDLGSATYEWKDLYIDGTANIDSLVADTADINAGTIDTITSLTAAGDLDIGPHGFRAATLTADGLTATRVVFAGASGLLSDDSDFTFSVDTLTVTKLGAFQATGAINFDSQNMTNINIDSGTIGGVTLDGAIAGGDQGITNVGDMTFADASIIAASATDTHTLLVKAGGLAGTSVITITSLDAGDTIGFANVTALVATGNLDIGAFDLRAATVTADGLTAGRVVFAGTAGVLTDDADMTFATDTLTVTKIAAFELTGKLTAGAVEIEGSGFDINGGTMASITLDGAVAGGDQAFTGVGDMTFTNGSILKSGASASDTLLLAANDTTCITLTTGATDKVELASVNALTAINDIDIGAHNLRAATMTADGLTATRVVYAGTDGLLSGAAELTWSKPTFAIVAQSETAAGNAIWLDLRSTVTSGDLTGVRSRVYGNAASSGANVRGGYLEAKMAAGSKYAAMLEGGLFHADYSAGSATISGDVRGFTAQISEGSGLNAANLYGGLINIQTRSDETITTDDVGLMVRNEAHGGTGRQMDAGFKLTDLYMSGGVKGFGYGIDLNGANIATADIRFSGGQTLASSATTLTWDSSMVLGGELDCAAHSVGFTQQTATGDGTTTIDWKLGNKFYFTFGAQNDTFTFTAPTHECNIVLVLKQDGTGSRLATWPVTVKWPAATAPTLSTGANDVDIMCFYYDGTNYHGVSSLDFGVPA